MNIAVIGSGGREHALCYKLKKSKKISNLICIPGNAGTKKIAKNINANITDFENLYKILLKNKIDLIVVGPENPLVDGIVDFFNVKKIKIFGPNKIASKLEGSKAFLKNLCKKNNIPTASFGIFDDLVNAKKFIFDNKIPIVVKADGLAAGKGVTICETKDQAINACIKILSGKFKSSSKIVIEEYLDGEEMSYFIIVDKNTHKFFGSAQDHKRVGENDIGPNTGGMGAYSPSSIISTELEKKIEEKIIQPTLSAMKKIGNPFRGFLYAGLMIVKNEPFLIEYNVRMGDPECQAIMARLDSDLFEIINLTTNDELNKIEINWKDEKSICIVLCAKGYPGNYNKDIEIEKLNDVRVDKDSFIFHAGTYEKEGNIFSSGGRVLNIVSLSNNLWKARNKAITYLNKINWKNGFFRKDIGWRAIDKK
jgi:phosphoribosylamine--glycine ligase